MAYKTIDSFNFKGKRVIVRIDINSEIKNNKIVPSERFLAPLKTIKELQKKKAKVVLIGHQGRPGSNDFTDFKQHYNILKKHIPKLKFINDVIGFKAVLAIKNLKEGEILLLDNVRSVKDELEPSFENKLTKRLAPLFDYYVNDAFSVSHRKQTSIIEFPKLMPSCIGRTMQKELENIDKLDLENCIFILGGSKTEDVSLLMNRKNILSTGVPAIVCLLAKNYDLGAENTRMRELSNEIKENISHITIPVDLAVNMKGKRKELRLSEFPSNYKILDIGSETIKQYSAVIKNAKSIFLKGTPGYSEIKGFEKGTKEILKAIEQSKAFSVIAGGHSTTALSKFKINKKKIGYISLSGGALVHYLSGKKLPGLEVLR